MKTREEILASATEIVRAGNVSITDTRKIHLATLEVILDIRDLLKQIVNPNGASN